MKKLIVLILLIALSAIISACGEASNAEEKEEAARFTGSQSDDLHIVTDTVTGCKYVIYLQGVGQGGAGGISVLMNSDGTQECE